jgi:hypothetical protein
MCELAIGAGEVPQFLRAENAGKELNRFGRAIHNQVRRDCSITLGLMG